MTYRRNFTQSEAVAIGRALEPIEREKASERQESQDFGRIITPENFPGVGTGRALARVASTVGMSRPTILDILEVIPYDDKDGLSKRLNACPDLSQRTG